MPGPLARYIEVLEVIAQSSVGLSVTDVCELTGLHKATASRLLKALLDADLLAATTDPRRPYAMGSRLISLVRDTVGARLVGGSFSKELESLSNGARYTAMMAKLSKGQVKIISLAFPTDPVVAHVHPGSYQRPILTCSLARAILAFQDEGFIRSVIDQKFAEPAIGSDFTAAESYAKLEDVRRFGASVCEEELQEGITSVAVPIKVRPSGVLASIGLVGFSADMKRADMPKYVNLLNQAKAAIEKKIEVFGLAQDYR